jgi:hypothetical protein
MIILFYFFYSNFNKNVCFVYYITDQELILKEIAWLVYFFLGTSQKSSSTSSFTLLGLSLSPFLAHVHNFQPRKKKERE